MAVHVHIQFWVLERQTFSHIWGVKSELKSATNEKLSDSRPRQSTTNTRQPTPENQKKTTATTDNDNWQSTPAPDSRQRGNYEKTADQVESKNLFLLCTEVGNDRDPSFVTNWTWQRHWQSHFIYQVPTDNRWTTMSISNSCRICRTVTDSAQLWWKNYVNSIHKHKIRTILCTIIKKI